MNQPIVYAVVSMVFFGLTDFVYKRAAAAGIRGDYLLMSQAWCFCPLVTSYAFISNRLVLKPAAIWGSVAGVFIFIALTFFVRSLKSGSVSIVASVFRMNFIVTVLLAAGFLSEPLTIMKAVGLALALMATWLLVAGGHPRAAGAPRQAQRGSFLDVAIATLAMGASNFFHTVGLRHGAVPETLAVAQAAAFMPLATSAVFLRQRNVHQPRLALKYGGTAAVLLAGAVVSLLLGVAGGQASVLVPIAQMGFIVTAPLGIIVLGEGLTARKAAGLASALLALAVLAAS